MLASDVKVMRKGTRSCRECRRRKIKCTWTSEQAAVCRECSEHHRQCSSQGLVDNTSVGKRSNLKIRIGKLESIIERLSKAHPEKALEVMSETDSSPSPSSSSIPSSQPSNAIKQMEPKDLKSPFLDLFDNDVLQRRNTPYAEPETLVKIKFTPETSDREKILSVITDEPNILDVLDVAGDWWIAWEDQYPGAKDLKARLSLRDSVALHLAAEDPVTVASALICIVMSLQQVRVGIDDHNLQLSVSPHRLVEHITIAVDQVILTKEDYINSMMGVQLLILKAKQHADSNQLRKAWLRIRQAITTAQKIDLAKPMPGMPAAEVLGRQRFMGSMFETDRFMSLLLGLPYAMDDRFTDKLATEVIGDHPDIMTRVRALRRITAIASGHVNDRNASSDPESVQATRNIQQSLTVAAASLPLDWWGITSQTTDLKDPMLAHENLMTQLWYYQTQALLQLPFMLKATSDPTLEQSRVTCLDSCRSLISIWSTLRSNPVLSAYTCKCEDFQGLLGAIVLLVGLLQYASKGLEPTGSSFDADMALIEITKETFRYARQQQGGNIAKQGLHVIDTLSSFLEDAGQGRDEPNNASLFVPYFGMISVQAGPVWAMKDTTRQVDASEIGLNSDNELKLPASIPSQEAFLLAPLSQPILVPNALGYENRFSSLENQQYLLSANQLPSPTSDWDALLLGSELQQDWNIMPELTTASI